MKKSRWMFICLPLCLLGCSKKNTEPASLIEGEKVSVIQNQNDLSEIEKEPEVFDDSPIEEVADSLSTGQTLLKVKVEYDNVNLRYGPGTDFDSEVKVNSGDVLYVIGFDDEIQTISEKTGRWIQVSQEPDTWNTWYWIFSSFTSMNKSLTVNKIDCVSDSELSNGKIEIGFKRNLSDKIESFTVPVKEFDNGYSFTWNASNEGFNYADPVGTFVYNPLEKSLSHFASFGGDSLSAWSMPTSDGKYLLSDYGTSAGIRSVSVFDIEKNKFIFTGGYYETASYSDGKLICVKSCSQEDEQIKAFVEKNPLPTEFKDIDKNLVKVCELYSHDLKSGEEKSVGYKYCIIE